MIDERKLPPPAYVELEKRLAKVEEWIAKEELYRKRKARYEELLDQDPKYSLKILRERHPDWVADIDAKTNAIVEQVLDEEKKGLL